MKCGKMLAWFLPPSGQVSCLNKTALFLISSTTDEDTSQTRHRPQSSTALHQPTPTWLYIPKRVRTPRGIDREQSFIVSTIKAQSTRKQSDHIVHINTGSRQTRKPVVTESSPRIIIAKSRVYLCIASTSSTSYRLLHASNEDRRREPFAGRRFRPIASSEEISIGMLVESSPAPPCWSLRSLPDLAVPLVVVEILTFPTSDRRGEPRHSWLRFIGALTGVDSVQLHRTNFELGVQLTHLGTLAIDFLSTI